MKIHFPALVTYLGVPVFCLALLAVAWNFMRGGGKPEAPAEPVLRLLCEESLRLPLAGIVSAYERRGGPQVEMEFMTLSGLKERLADGADPDLVLLGVGDAAADGRIGTGSLVEVAANGRLRAFLPNPGEPSESASGFLGFLSGSFATGILGREESAAR